MAYTTEIDSEFKTLRAEADRVFEVRWLKVAGFSESGVGDAPAAWAFGKLSDWDTRLLCEYVPRLAGAEPPDSESSATLSASARSVDFRLIPPERNDRLSENSGSCFGPCPELDIATFQSGIPGEGLSELWRDSSDTAATAFPIRAPLDSRGK